MARNEASAGSSGESKSRPGNSPRIRRIAGRLLAGAVVLAGAFVLTLAIPVEQWRTGEPPVRAPLSDVRPSRMPEPARRVWIDADAACGAGPRVDPDDCLAIEYLARHDDLEIAGLSTVFGNAPLEVTDSIARELAAILSLHGGAPVPVHRGAAEPVRAGTTPPTEAQQALIDELTRGSLTILALGPLTNLAAALGARPDLHANVERIVAVMGRRPGHIFHPAEGSGSGRFLGHGPVFRDFNVAMDGGAVEAIVSTGIPIVLVPYEAAREVEIEGADLDRIAEGGPAGGWVARRARDWLEYWNRDIGRAGFYPFDLVAAYFLTEPERFACADVRLEVRRDRTVLFPFSRMPALLIEPGEPSADSAGPIYLYCHSIRDATGGPSAAARVGAVHERPTQSGAGPPGLLADYRRVGRTRMRGSGAWECSDVGYRAAGAALPASQIRGAAWKSSSVAS
jgi:purine nucleosidase